MSRIGKKPIPIPKGVTVKIAPDAVEVQGPKGKLRQPLPPGILFAQDAGALVAKLSREDDELRKFHGLARSLVANAVAGVTDGFKKELDIVGVGYRAELKAGTATFKLVQDYGDHKLSINRAGAGSAETGIIVTPQTLDSWSFEVPSDGTYYLHVAHYGNGSFPEFASLSKPAYMTSQYVFRLQQ